MGTNELDITVSGKTYRLTFSRALSFDERRRISGMSFAGNVSTPAEVQKIVEATLAVLKVQNEAMLAVLDVWEDV